MVAASSGDQPSESPGLDAPSSQGEDVVTPPGFDEGSAEMLGTTGLGCEIVGGTSNGKPATYVSPVCTEGSLIQRYCNLTGDEVFVDSEVNTGHGADGLRIATKAYPTTQGPARFSFALEGVKDVDLYCPSGDRVTFNPSEWAAFADSADGVAQDYMNQ